MDRSFVLVANRGAGSSDRTLLGRAYDRLRDAGRVALHETSTPRELDDVVRTVGDRILVVAGGDGSLHAAVNALQRAGRLASTTVGLIPLGTGNDLARTAGVPFDADAAAALVVDGHARGQDLLVGPDGLVAVNAVHLGIGAEAVRLGERAKSALGPVGFSVGAVLAGIRCPGWRLKVEVDGAAVPTDGRSLMVGISLGRTIGGGTELAPEADPRDGLADVTVASTTGPVRRLRYAAGLRRGAHTDLDDVRTARGQEVVVTGEPVRANVDGEVVGPLSRWEWSVVRHGWRLIAP